MVDDPITFCMNFTEWTTPWFSRVDWRWERKKKGRLQKCHGHTWWKQEWFPELLATLQDNQFPGTTLKNDEIFLELKVKQKFGFDIHLKPEKSVGRRINYATNQYLGWLKFISSFCPCVKRPELRKSVTFNRGKRGMTKILGKRNKCLDTNIFCNW